MRPYSTRVSGPRSAFITRFSHGGSRCPPIGGSSFGLESGGGIEMRDSFERLGDVNVTQDRLKPVKSRSARRRVRKVRLTMLRAGPSLELSRCKACGCVDSATWRFSGRETGAVVEASSYPARDQVCARFSGRASARWWKMESLSAKFQRPLDRRDGGSGSPGTGHDRRATFQRPRFSGRRDGGRIPIRGSRPRCSGFSGRAIGATSVHAGEPRGDAKGALWKRGAANETRLHDATGSSCDAYPSSRGLRCATSAVDVKCAYDGGSDFRGTASSEMIRLRVDQSALNRSVLKP